MLDAPPISPCSEESWRTRLPPADWLSFEGMLASLRSPCDWREPAGFELDGFYDAAVEAADLEDGLALLAAPQPLSHDSSLSIRYVGEGCREDGCIFYAFLFQGRGFDVFVGIEDDLPRARFHWRGDEAACLRAELLLRRFEGETLARLR